MKKMLWFAVLLLSVQCVAQKQEKVVPATKTTTSTPAPELALELSSEEAVELREIQVEVLQAELNLRNAQDEVSRGRTALGNKVQEAFSKRKITTDDYSLCAGPGAAECGDVPKGKIVLRPKIKEVKKTPAKP